MVELGQAEECEVVLAFLRAEAKSPRNSRFIMPNLARLELQGFSPERLIANPDLENEEHNGIRRDLLAYRGFGRGLSLFKGFPEDATWRRVELEASDLRRLRYLNEENWLDLSEGTRDPSRVAERIAKGELHENPGEHILAVQARLRRGEAMDELIAAEGTDEQLILIEGHYRATAYVSLGWQDKVLAFLASSPRMKGWFWY